MRPKSKYMSRSYLYVHINYRSNILFLMYFLNQVYVVLLLVSLSRKIFSSGVLQIEELDFLKNREISHHRSKRERVAKLY